MTKMVRVENADTSNNPIVVQVWERRDTGPDEMVTEQFLYNPCDMTQGITIHGQRYLVVKEV